MNANLKGFHNNAMDMMLAAGGRYPPGTIFPNHAYVGSGFEVTQTPKKGLRLVDLSAEGPFALAGLIEGDVVTRVAGERWKSYGDFYDGLHKAAGSEMFQVEFYRNGDKQEVTVARAYRAEESSPEFAAEPFHTPAGPQTVIVESEMSIADELAKFAKLRDSGVISADEFEAQKARLLSAE